MKKTHTAISSKNRGGVELMLMLMKIIDDDDVVQGDGGEGSKRCC